MSCSLFLRVSVNSVVEMFILFFAHRKGYARSEGGAVTELIAATGYAASAYVACLVSIRKLTQYHAAFFPHM